MVNIAHVVVAQFVLFVVLKLTGAIDWAWLWVAAPMWAGYLPLFLVGLGVGLGRAADRRIPVVRRRADRGRR